MERTYARRRRTASGSRTGSDRRGASALPARERRRLAQLAASIGLFLLVFAGRGLFPGPISQWKETLGRNTDFAAAFSDLGAALSRGEPVLDTLGELWVEVFAGGAATVPREEEDRTPVLTQRMREQLADPGDAVSLWAAARRAATVKEAAARTAKTVSAPEPAEETARQEELLTAQPALAVPLAAAPDPPAPVTAAAQDYDGEGRALPASVSTQFYQLGLEETVTPVAAALTSDYGYRDHPVSGDYLFHRGVDLGAPSGTEIIAFAAGTVAYTGRDDVCGLYFKLDHGNGVSTFYCHCSALNVSDGQTVAAGEAVARVGETGNATGPHLHFALLKDGVYLDPLYYIEVG